jgi:hypothetical protein
MILESEVRLDPSQRRPQQQQHQQRKKVVGVAVQHDA